MLLRFDFATRENRSNRFILRVVVLCLGCHVAELKPGAKDDLDPVVAGAKASVVGAARTAIAATKQVKRTMAILQ